MVFTLFFYFGSLVTGKSILLEGTCSIRSGISPRMSGNAHWLEEDGMNLNNKQAECLYRLGTAISDPKLAIYSAEGLRCDEKHQN